MPEIVNIANFGKEVLESDIPVMVDFFATWCGPCKMIAPFVEEISESASGKAKIVKVDIDESPQLADQYNIQGVPTLMFFKDGKMQDQIVGVAPKNVINDKLNSLLV